MSHKSSLIDISDSPVKRSRLLWDQSTQNSSWITKNLNDFDLHNHRDQQLSTTIDTLLEAIHIIVVLILLLTLAPNAKSRAIKAPTQYHSSFCNFR